MQQFLQGAQDAELQVNFLPDRLLGLGLSPTDLADTVRGCMVRNRFFLEPRAMPADPARVPDPESELSHFRADLEELPVPKNSLDAVVLHHVLETAEDPRTAIREVSRVLAPGGRLLVVSFNPWSLWGMRGAYAHLFRDSFSGLRFIGPRRMLDWLTVLGFELQGEVRYLAFGLPFPTRNKDAGIWQRLRAMASGLPLGGVYLISAVKQAAAVRPDWTPSAVRGRKLAPAAYPKLSARVAHLPIRTEPERIEDPG